MVRLISSHIRFLETSGQLLDHDTIAIQVHKATYSTLHTLYSLPRCNCKENSPRKSVEPPSLLILKPTPKPSSHSPNARQHFSAGNESTPKKELTFHQHHAEYPLTTSCGRRT